MQRVDPKQKVVVKYPAAYVQPQSVDFCQLVRIVGDSDEMCYGSSVWWGGVVLDHLPEHNSYSESKHSHSLDSLQDLPVMCAVYWTPCGTVTIMKDPFPLSSSVSEFLEGNKVCSWKTAFSSLPLWMGLVVRFRQKSLRPPSALPSCSPQHGLQLWKPFCNHGWMPSTGTQKLETVRVTGNITEPAF